MSAALADCALQAGCPTPLACTHANHCVGAFAGEGRFDCSGQPLGDTLDLDPESRASDRPFQQDPNVND